MQTFEDLYSSYCDCGKFVNWVDAPDSDELTHIEKQVVDLVVTDMDVDLASSKDEEEEEAGNQFAWFISRGAEMCDVSDGICKLVIASFFL